MDVRKLHKAASALRIRKGHQRSQRLTLLGSTDLDGLRQGKTLNPNPQSRRASAIPGRYELGRLLVAGKVVHSQDAKKLAIPPIFPKMLAAFRLREQEWSHARRRQELEMTGMGEVGQRSNGVNS
jgi:hypothetical protein